MPRWTTRSRAIQRKRVRQAVKQAERRIDNDGEWYSQRLSAKYISRSKQQLWRYKDYCPQLDRAITPRKFQDEHGRLVDYDSKRELDEFRATNARLKHIPKVPDGITPADAARLARVGVGMIKHVRQHGSPFLLDQRMVSDKVLAKTKRGHTCRKVVLTRKPAETYAACRNAQLVVPSDQMTVRDAAKYLGLNRRTVLMLVSRGVIDATPKRWVRSGKYLRKGYYLFRSSVEAYKKRVTIKQSAVAGKVEGKDGLWLPIWLGIERYPNARAKLLRRYQNKPCPQLQGRILHAKRFPPAAGTKRHKFPFVLHFWEPDLEQLSPPAVGMAGQIRYQIRYSGAIDKGRIEQVLDPKAQGARTPVIIKSEAPETPFVPTAFQKRILEALQGRALTADNLQQRLHIDRKSLYRRGLRELQERGLVKNSRRIGGYYRQDDPPAKYADFLRENRDFETEETEETKTETKTSGT